MISAGNISAMALSYFSDVDEVSSDDAILVRGTNVPRGRDLQLHARHQRRTARGASQPWFRRG